MSPLVNDTAWETRASTTGTAEHSAPTARTPAATTRPAARRGARRPRQDNAATGNNTARAARASTRRNERIELQAASTMRAAVATARPTAWREARTPRYGNVAIGQQHDLGDARQRRRNQRNRPIARVNNAGGGSHNSPTFTARNQTPRHDVSQLVNDATQQQVLKKVALDFHTFIVT